MSSSSATPMTSSSWIDMLAGIISESKRVVSAHTRHFLALSVLFLLPPSLLLLLFSSSSSPFLFPLPHSSNPPQSLLRSPPPPPLPLLPLSLLILSALLLLAASASISHSVHCSFFGRPVNLLPSLFSVPLSLLRLLLTLLPIAALPILLLSLLLLSYSFLPSLLLPLSAISALFLLYLSLCWSLAFPVTVLESTWGLYPLRRSAYLISGLRPATYSIFLFFSIGIALVLWGFSLGSFRAGGDWLPMVARTVVGSAVTAVLMLFWIVSGTVMYMYCKAVHGELAAEIAEEFAWQYVFLPFDEHKVPRVVSVVQQG